MTEVAHYQHRLLSKQSKWPNVPVFAKRTILPSNPICSQKIATILVLMHGLGANSCFSLATIGIILSWDLSVVFVQFYF